MVRVYYSLYDRMLSKAGLYEAFKKVKSAKGAAGIDGQTIADFSENLDENLTILAKELKDKSYEPKPVKRVEIPKAGGKGIRKLGIPSEGIGLYNKHCWRLCNRFTILSFIRQAMGIGPAGAVIRQ